MRGAMLFLGRKYAIGVQRCSFRCVGAGRSLEMERARTTPIIKHYSTCMIDTDMVIPVRLHDRESSERHNYARANEERDAHCYSHLNPSTACTHTCL